MDEKEEERKVKCGGFKYSSVAAKESHKAAPLISKVKKSRFDAASFSTTTTSINIKIARGCRKWSE